MIAVLRGTRVHIDVLSARFAHAFNPLVHIAIGHLRLGVGDFDAAVIAQFKLGGNLKFRFEGHVNYFAFFDVANKLTEFNLASVVMARIENLKQAREEQDQNEPKGDGLMGRFHSRPRFSV